MKLVIKFAFNVEFDGGNHHRIGSSILPMYKGLRRDGTEARLLNKEMDVGEDKKKFQYNIQASALAP